MRNFRAALVALAVGALAARAGADPPRGFGVERFMPSAPGGGWLVMDALDLSGNLGGALELTLGYAANPLRVTDGLTRLAVVSSEALPTTAGASTSTSPRRSW
jgi:hypothetical protein